MVSAVLYECYTVAEVSKKAQIAHLLRPSPLSLSPPFVAAMAPEQGRDMTLFPATNAP